MLAFEQIWRTVQKFRQLAPFLLDILLEKEYELIKTNPELKEFLQRCDENELLKQCKLIDSEIESHRIYIPALIWQLYYSYRLISIRPILKYKLIVTSKTSDTPIIPWYKDSTLHTIIVNLLDEKELEEFDAQQSKIIELRYFGGLTIEETAEVLKISESTVKREWTMARAWLFERVSHS